MNRDTAGPTIGPKRHVAGLPRAGRSRGNAVTAGARHLWQVVLLVGLAVPGVGHAGGFATARFGGEQGHPASDHPTAIYYNPAGLALLPGTRLYVEGLLALRTASYERPTEAIDRIIPPGGTGPGTPEAAVAANAGKAELSNVLASPFLGVVSDLGVENLGVGLAFYVPFGGQAGWDRNSDFASDQLFPGAVDGVQRWSVIEGEQRYLYLTAASAYRLPRQRLSMGLAVNAVRSQVNTIRARTVLGRDDLVTASGSIMEGRSLLDVSGWSLALGAGLLWQPQDRLWIGASYQTQPGFGEYGASGTLTNQFGPGERTTSDVELRMALPDVARLGVRYRPLERWELRLSGDYQRWSALKEQCLLDGVDEAARCVLDERGAVDEAEGGRGVVVNIRRQWQDTVGVRGGASYWVLPELELGAGLSFDSNAVPDENLDPSLMDMNKVVGTLGARYALEGTGLTGSFTLAAVNYFSRTVEPSARDQMNERVTYSQPSRVPDGAGEYKQFVMFGALGVEYAF